MAFWLAILVLVVLIVVSLVICVRLTQALLREMAVGWELDRQRRGPEWQRGQERLGPAPRADEQPVAPRR